MSFLEKIFTTKKPKNFDHKAGFDFLDRCLGGCEKWFESDSESHNGNILASVKTYVNLHGLEKSSQYFSILPELKQAISKYFQGCNIHSSPNEIIIRPGIFELMRDLYKMADFDKNDKILFTLPVSGYFVQQCKDNEMGVSFLSSDVGGWKINWQELDSILATQPIKIVFFNYPNGASGSVLSQKDVTELTKIIAKYPDLLVAIDESLKEAFDHSSRPISLASSHLIAKQIITISSLRCYNLGSLNFAFACTKNKRIIGGLFSDQINVSHINQHIAIAALEDGGDSKRSLIEVFEKCRQNSDLVLEELKIINDNLNQKLGTKDDHIKAILDDSQIFDSMLLQFSGLKGTKANLDNKTLESDLDIAEFLKREAGIAMMPGQCYLLPPEEMILKLYLLKSKQELRSGFKKIGQALMQLKIASKALSGVSVSKVQSDNVNKSR